MREEMPIKEDVRVKKKIISWKNIILTYCLMLLLVGVQMGIIVFPGFLSMNGISQTIIILIYWVIITVLFTFIMNRQIINSYDKPIRKLGKATKKVAEGDFSIYVEPLHTAENRDFIDVMFQIAVEYNPQLCHCIKGEKI